MKCLLFGLIRQYKLYDGYKQLVGRQICFAYTETMEAWGDMNTCIGSSQPLGLLCRLQKSIFKKKKERKNKDGSWIT